MKYLSVCSGIEAATVAWHPLGWTPWAFSEIEKFPSAVLAHHYPDVPNLGDMTKFKEWPDATIDVLVGGTPCQSFSVAGLRKGLADPRGNLMLTYLAIADRYRPEWVVWENVPGVLSSNGGRDFGTFLGALGQLGYGWSYRVLDAQYFGVPQRRRRVFVVGHLGDWHAAAAVLFERHSLQGHPAPSREKKKDVAGTLASRTTGGGFPGTDEACKGYIQPVAFGGGNTKGAIDVSTAVKGNNGNYDFESETFITGPLMNNGKAAGSATQQDAEQGMLVSHTLRGEGFDASEDGTGRGTPLVPVAFAENSRNEIRLEGGDGKRAGTLSTGGGKAGQGVPCIAFHGTQDPDVSGDVTHPLGRNQGQEASLMQGAAVRRLTPRECERLQDFPDDYTLIPWCTWQEAQRKGSSYESLLAERGMKLREPAGEQCPDGPRYKALGNSMAVPVMRWIGERIQAVDEIKNGTE